MKKNKEKVEEKGEEQNKNKEEEEQKHAWEHMEWQKLWLRSRNMGSLTWFLNTTTVSLSTCPCYIWSRFKGVACPYLYYRADLKEILFWD